MGGPKSEPKSKPPPATITKPFDFPPAAARTRMAVPAYDLMFGKLWLRRLFDDYYPRQPGLNVDARVLLKPPQPDPHIDLTATMSNDGGEALLRWQRDLDDPHTFMDLLATPSESMLKLRSCAYYPKYGIGVFGTFPLLMANRVCSEDYGVMGLRYVSENLSVGASFVPFPSPNEVPYGGWLVGRKGRLSAGIQYKPLNGRIHPMPFRNLKNWNCAISYGIGSTSPLSSPFICTLELIRGNQLVASAYQRHILQKGENDHLSYFDFGLELATRVGKDKSEDSVDKSLFQLAASCQLDSNLLLKGKLGPSKSSAALAWKLQPYFILSATVENDRSKGTSYGFGICVEEYLDHCYQTINSDWTVLTETKVNDDGEEKTCTFRCDLAAGKFDNLPTGMKPIDKIL